MDVSDQIVSRCEFHNGYCIDSKYTIEQMLGEGAFGVVYRVTDTGGKVYALKLFKFWEVPGAVRKNLLKRVMMEFETGQIASHYLVHSIYHGYVKGNPYILMELCSGGDLLRYMERNRVDMVKLASSVLHGLGDLHRCGKVHRDLKPENVLVKENETFVLTDFGISGDRNKRLTERNFLGKPRQIFGTYAYMPPEQVIPQKDATVLPTTDVFSFGVMMYQVITGKLPFGELQNENDLVMYMKRGREGQWDKDLLLRAPEGKQWQNIIVGCLVPDFKQRLQNTKDILNMLPYSQQYEPAPGTDDVFRDRTAVNGLMLRVMQGEEYGKEYKLNGLLQGNRMLTMGRRDADTDNMVPIQEVESCYISRKHCTLELEADGNIWSWYIRDGQWDRNTMNWRESLNGTFINSTQVTKEGMTFRPGDIISIGDVKLRVEGY